MKFTSGMARGVRSSSIALVLVVIAGVVLVSDSTAGKTRSEYAPKLLGVLVVPEAYLEAASVCCFFPSESSCVFFVCGVR